MGAQRDTDLAQASALVRVGFAACTRRHCKSPLGELRQRQRCSLRPLLMWMLLLLQRLPMQHRRLLH